MHTKLKNDKRLKDLYHRALTFDCLQGCNKDFDLLTCK